MRKTIFRLSIPIACYLFLMVLISCSAQVDAGEDILLTREDSMLEAVNRLRQTGCKCGARQMPPVAPLRWNEQLAQAAVAHAADLSKRNTLSHTGRDGSTVGERASRAGYDWQMVGENLAMGYSSTAEVIAGWRSSPDHCKNMMNPDYREMGAAQQNALWVQVFGTPW